MALAALIYVALVLAIWIGRGALLQWTLDHDASVSTNTYDECVDPAPSVSVVVPARNEEQNLPKCLESLLAQDYPNFDVTVVDDRSTDRTAEVVESFCRRDRRVRLVRNTVLPAGWTGRNHALEHGSRDARGEYLLFTDADVLHAPKSISQAVTYTVRNELDMLGLLIRTGMRRSGRN